MEELLPQVSFGMVKITPQRKPIKYRPKMVLLLIEQCLKNKTILDEYILQDWFMEKIIKPRQTKLREYDYTAKRNPVEPYPFTYVLEYDVRKKEIKKNGGLMDSYNLTEAKAILKYHIGNLVVNGYLVAIPTISIKNIEELNSNNNA